ncbi:SPX domain-domain-containing protein [Kockovaella imperatae]|uniref:SPX domain-domain-containing protein n=1 Tax=Kockovaella imperatae TaxID=4999 RepID=A0A1Y1UM38_9TREE|nr:SPX domain-domain-containing protein [Kockovaella imperatae]ORX38546.1 SPX domain-domain-containing protein [Kockovaella imperatae]
MPSENGEARRSSSRSRSSSSGARMRSQDSGAAKAAKQAKKAVSEVTDTAGKVSKAVGDAVGGAVDALGGWGQLDRHIRHYNPTFYEFAASSFLKRFGATSKASKFLLLLVALGVIQSTLPLFAWPLDYFARLLSFVFLFNTGHDLLKKGWGSGSDTDAMKVKSFLTLYLLVSLLEMVPMFLFDTTYHFGALWTFLLPMALFITPNKSNPKETLAVWIADSIFAQVSNVLDSVVPDGFVGSDQTTAFLSAGILALLLWAGILGSTGSYIVVFVVLMGATTHHVGKEYISAKDSSSGFSKQMTIWHNLMAIWLWRYLVSAVEGLHIPGVISVLGWIQYHLPTYFLWMTAIFFGMLLTQKTASSSKRADTWYAKWFTRKSSPRNSPAEGSAESASGKSRSSSRPSSSSRDGQRSRSSSEKRKRQISTVEDAEEFDLLPLSYNRPHEEQGSIKLGEEADQTLIWTWRSERLARRGDRMKFGTLLELNSNIEWWNYYVDYDALKKLFPSTPLDPSYLATQSRESSSLLPTARQRSTGKWASPEDFRKALDSEREKVETFYRSKEAEFVRAVELLEEEIAALEYRDLGADDVIKEVDEEDEEGPEDDDDVEARGESDQLISPRYRRTSARPRFKPRASLFGRFTSPFKARRSANLSTHETDILEASVGRQSRLAPPGHGMTASVSTLGAGEPVSPSLQGSRTMPKRRAPSSDHDSAEDRMLAAERRTSMSSNSSHERDIWTTRTHLSLGLVEMDPDMVPDFARHTLASTENRENGEAHEDNEEHPVFVWTASHDRATVLRIGFKKRISAVWLDVYSLKQYVDLNLTAFEKILKKYDKNTNSKLKKEYVSQEVLQSYPWQSSTRESLDTLLARILFLYRRVAVAGDEDLAKEQLRSQLREKVVVDRETVWSQMVSGRREGIFRSVEQDVDHPAFGSANVEKKHSILTTKSLIFAFALAVLIGIVLIQPFPSIPESNCLAMLVFCTILWATEAIPLFVTSLAVPLLVVFLRVLKDTSGETGARMTAANATKYIFSQMFSPTIMLLIGGFTIAAVLSKTRLDVMTATRVLNAAGTKPSVVLLVLMFVATFASMWISNVAAPTLCYALVKPILEELHPKSNFSKCLIIAIALASNIGGQASPISSPQNLIALGSMSPPLSWIEWFAISIPVAGSSVVAIWAFLHVNYKWETDLVIPKMRKNTDSLSKTHYFVLFISGLTIALWCAEKSMEGVVGDMGVIAIIPLLAFFGTGILSKEDFHSFHWSIVFLAMGGIALGKATLSSGLLDDLDRVLEKLVEGMGLYSILIIFSIIALVIATFISHTIAAVLLVPIATRIGDSLNEPHPRLLIMATALICSAGMGLPVSGFPNMTAITQENKLGQRFIGASDFLKNGIPASILTGFIIVTVGYAIMRGLG